MIEKLLQKLVQMLPDWPFLQIKGDHDLDRFAAHTGWSIAIISLSYIFWGEIGLLVSAGLWVIESLYWKFIVCGHLKLLIKRQDPAINDLMTNLFSRLVFPVVFVVVYFMCRK